MKVNNKRNIIFRLLIFILPLLFTACSKDDDIDLESYDKALLGKWMWSSGMPESGESLSYKYDYDIKGIFEFKKDGTFSYMLFSFHGSAHHGYEEEIYTGTWHSNDNWLYMEVKKNLNICPTGGSVFNEGESLAFKYRIENSSLYLGEMDSSGDIFWDKEPFNKVK